MTKEIIMTGYEQQLHTRAEMLEETSDLAAAVTEIMAGASAAGLDPRAIVSLRAAVRALDPAGGTPDGGQDGRGYASDAEMLEAVSDAEEQLLDRLRDVGQLQEQTVAALDRAHDDRERAQGDLQDARLALAAAYAMPTRQKCDGCHGRKARAIAAAEADVTDAEERITDATRRIGICEDTAENLDQLGQRLQTALVALRQVPHDLGETYELIYAFIRRGGRMPREGRWITGGTPAPV